MVGISVDSVETSAKLWRRLELTDAVRLLSDPDLGAIRAYGVEDVGRDLSLPATIVVDRDGTVRWIYVGDAPRDRPAVDATLAAVSGSSTRAD